MPAGDQEATTSPQSRESTISSQSTPSYATGTDGSGSGDSETSGEDNSSADESPAGDPPASTESSAPDERPVSPDPVPALADPTVSVDRTRRALPSGYTIEDGQRIRVRDDETVIYELVATHRGPIPQAELSNRTDLAPSRVSRALSTLIEAGLVDKRRLGRTFQVTDVDQDEESEDPTTIPRFPSDRS